MTTRTQHTAAWAQWTTMMMVGLCALLITSNAHGETTAATKGPQNGSQTTQGKLVAHEWGTFTSVSGNNGVALEWRPLDGPTDLPSFVYTQAKPGPDNPPRRNGSGGKGSSLLRMETPVVYFYSDRTRDVSLSVDFPQGTITEWYPRARITPRGLDWGTFQVRPKTRSALPTDRTPNHYYTARQTDANPVRVRGEAEKFLFYRGVGDVALPLEVALTKCSNVYITQTQDKPIGRLMVFRRDGNRVGFEVLDDPTVTREMLPIPALDANIGQVHRRLYAMLVAEGLYPKEAKSMIATWREHWFEDGIRVFNLLPRDLTDTLLPLRISPAPTELVRVFVGRIELFTDAQVHNVRDRLQQAHDSTPQQRQARIDALRKDYGRFLEPLVESALDRASPDSPLQTAAWLTDLRPTRRSAR